MKSLILLLFCLNMGYSQQGMKDQLLYYEGLKYEKEGYLLEAADIYLKLISKNPEDKNVKKSLKRVYFIIKKKNEQLRKILEESEN